MLYQTSYPLLFQFHPLHSSSTTIPLSTISPQKLSLFSHLPHPHSQVSKTVMECVVETALKTSLRKDITPQTFVDEISALNAQNGTTSDDFFVDDLLDFSHVEEQQQQQEQEEQHQQQQEHSLCLSLKQNHETSNPNTTFSLKEDYSSLPTNDLNVPSDDVADLEWLSHFVEDSDSFSGMALTTTTEKNPKSLVVFEEPKPKQENSVFTTFKTPVQTKARSKRARTGVRVWPFGSTDSSSSSTTTTTSSSTSSSPTSPLMIYTNMLQVQSFDSVKVKKPKKIASSNGSGHVGAVVMAAPPRRCSHCGVTKTPQWRSGPLGAKTLCNACGVRFKSGRLLPEYRPACSPTFSSELHSNHHRKVLEMRRKKEVVGGVEIEVETGLSRSPVVPSF